MIDPVSGSGRMRRRLKGGGREEGRREGNLGYYFHELSLQTLSIKIDGLWS